MMVTLTAVFGSRRSAGHMSRSAQPASARIAMRAIAAGNRKSESDPIAKTEPVPARFFLVDGEFARHPLAARLEFDRRAIRVPVNAHGRTRQPLRRAVGAELAIVEA